MKTNKFWSIIVLVMFSCMSASLMSCGSDGDNDNDNEVPTGGTSGVGENTGEMSVTGGIENVYATGAKMIGYVNVAKELLVATEFGVMCSEKSNVDAYNYDIIERSVSLEGEKYSVVMKNLKPSTQYFYRSYTKIGNNYTYGVEKTFTTKAVSVTAKLEKLEDCTAVFSCTTTIEDFDLQDNGNNYGIMWGTDKKLDENNCYRISASDLKFGKYNVTISDFDYSTTYYYCAYTYVSGKYICGQIQELKTQAFARGAVDLGLSVKWANCNVCADYPQGCGLFFAWGDTHGYGIYDHNFDEDTYFDDHSMHLDLMDDAANVNWGGSWRMPTCEEVRELIDKCTWIWTTHGGVHGYNVVGKNGNSIFLPAQGYRKYTYYYDYGYSGYYWTSDSIFLNFNNEQIETKYAFSYGTFWDYTRFCGMQVRAVCE